MLIFPAIDLKSGRCVRLLRGEADSETVYSDDPVSVAQSFANAGAEWLHVVDLDAAFTGNSSNRQVIEDIVTNVGIAVQVGGGMRTENDVESMLNSGVRRVIIGTAAVENPQLARSVIEKHGAEAIAIGLDARDGHLATRGWTDVSEIDATEFARQLAGLGARWVIYTDIGRDGTLLGPNLEATRRLASASGLNVIASGGVSSLDDLRRIRELAPFGVAGAIIGKALYEGKFTLTEALDM